MPPNKDATCAGCEEFRPLLQRYRGKQTGDGGMRPMSHDDAISFMRYIKHWPNNIHMVSAHISTMFKTQEDVQAMHGLTLSFVMMGLKITGLFLTRQSRRSLDSSSRHSSAGSSSESIPDACNSEPGSTTVSPVPEDTNNPKSKSPLEVVDLTSISPDSDIVILNEGNSSTNQPSNSSQGGPDIVVILNEPSTSTEDGKDDEDDPGLHGWTAKEMEELCQLYHRVFLPHFPLYLAARSLMRPDERLRCEQLQLAAPLHMETFIYWFNRGGIDQMSMYFQQTTAENSDLGEALLLTSMSYHVRYFLLYDGLANSIANFRAHVMTYLLKLSIDEFRKPPCKDIAAMMWTMRREQGWPAHMVDTEGLNLAYKFFSCSSHLTLRLVGLTEISSYIGSFHEFMQELEPRVAMQLGAHLARWILEKRIVEEIFGQNAHVELISRSFHIINFLSAHQMLSIQHIDSIWNAAQMNYISRHVMEMLPNIIKTMEPSRLMHLYRKLGEMDTAHHSEQSVIVISVTIRTIWAYAINQKSPISAGSSSPPKRPSFSFPSNVMQKVLHRQLAGAGSPSEESASSSGTGSDDESGSEYESDDQEGSSGMSKIPGIATLIPSHIPPNIKLDPKHLQLRLATLPVLPIGRDQRNSVVITHEVSSEDGSTDDEEDCEDDEEDGVEEVTRSVQTPGTSRMLRNQLLKSSSSERSKRSPCPSRDSISLQPRKRPAIEQHVGNVMERILSSKPIARSALPPLRGPMEGNSALNSLHLLAGMPMGNRVQQSSPVQLDTSGDIDDDMMTQASDGADAEINSSTSDMSEKMQDVDLDLSETQPEDESMVMDDEDDMDISSSDPNNSTLSSEDTFRIKASLQAHAHKVRQVQFLEALAKNRSIEYKIDDVTKPGMTLLWDLLQENDPGTVAPVVLAAAERELVGLIISSQHPRIIGRFFDAYHENVKQHRAVCVSLRLLSKLIQPSQFNQKLEKVQQVVQHFFADLALFADNPPRDEMRKTAEIRVRLNFLQLVFSSQLTDKKFRLRVEDVEVLWRCFVEKLSGLDEICGWLHIQLNCAESHALNAQTVYHLFKEHLGKLKPANMTITAFKLYLSCLQHLTGLDVPEGIKMALPNGQVIRAECADIAWLCAMFGESDVSDCAVKHLNNYYCVQCVKSQKDEKGGVLVNYKEQEIFKKSMEYMTNAMENGLSGPLAFQTITRCFGLMRRQIESYRQKYGFHLRLWQLTGSGILSHQPVGFTPVMHVRGFCYFHASFNMGDERTVDSTVTMLPTNTFGELRAELIYALWKVLADKTKAEPKDPREALEQLYNFIDTRGGPMYITHRNAEYGQDSDEMTLHELQLRQAESHILVTFGSSRKPKISVRVPSLPPSRETIPMIIAASPKNFETLFNLQILLDITGELDPEVEVQRKSVAKHLWDFLMILPTSEVVLNHLKLLPPMDQPTKEQWKQILPHDDPHRLLYALQAMDNLSGYPGLHGANVYEREVCTNWAEQIIAKGGFERLYELILTPSLQEATGSNDGLEHQRECLCVIMKVFYTLSMDNSRRQAKAEEESGASSSESSGEEVVVDGEATNESPESRKRKTRTKSDEKGGAKKGRSDQPMMRPVTVRFKQSVLQILDTTEVLTALMKFQYNSVLPLPIPEQKPLRTHRFIRQQVIKLAFDFLINWASWNPLVIPALSKHEFLTEWIRRLALESVDSQVTLETCMFIERMCRMEPDYELSCALLVPLVALMPVAEGFKCLRPSGRDDKFPHRPSSRHFYESLSKLLEIIPKPVVVDKVDLDSLCAQIAVSLENRPIHEPRNGCYEDDGLIGLLKVATQVLSHNPVFKSKSSGQKLLLTIHSLLFDLPTLKNRDLPKCKSQASRMAGYNCLIEIVRNVTDNFISLGRLLLKDELERSCQLWDYWPRDDTRADCGYVGINNLGATCYMATTMQHLYMIPEVRKTVLEALPNEGKSASANALGEMQRMFAFLLDSERKAYSPDPFCRVYEMNNQPLNPTEQKDMMEYFSDLVTKMEDMSPSMKEMVRRLFTGKNCNTVVSLDCGHVSQTTEDFTTVRCQVNNMRNLYESLNDVCVKDVLEGNNMYRCGQCNREVRAEKRACFRALPEILVLNTLRYTFNMVTMQREKVNTHFSFPLKLDMSSYMEENIYRKDGVPMNNDQYNYELIGVTVHTGTADGGHYYSFIRDLESGEDDRWCLFNDAEVRQFDPDQLGDECFGGEQHKQFEHPTDRFLDFGLEKTNSAYMVFYQRSEKVRDQLAAGKIQPNIPKDLQKWVFDDTVTFIHDTNIFDRQYFEFIYKLCATIPGSIPAKDHAEAMSLSGQLGISFMWETLVHARDRLLLNSFLDLMSKVALVQPSVVEWFFHHLVDDSRWLTTILVSSPIALIRYTFQRFVVNFFQRLRPQHPYLLEFYTHDTAGFGLLHLVGKFCRQCLLLLNDNEVRMHWRQCSDLFLVLFEFAKIGVTEAWFLLVNGLFTICYNFYIHVRRLKDTASPMIGPFNLTANILEIVMLGAEEADNSDRFSPELDKDKPTALTHMVRLLKLCIEAFQFNVFNCKYVHLKNEHASPSPPDPHVLASTHGDIEQFVGVVGDGGQLDFICALIRDGVEHFQTPRLAADLYFDKPEKARLCVHYIVQKMIDLSLGTPEVNVGKKERDKDMQVRAYLNALAEIIRHGIWCGTTLSQNGTIPPEFMPEMPKYTSYLLERMDNLIMACPIMAIQWLSDHAAKIEELKQWCFDHMDWILEHYGVSVGKPPSAQRDDLQIEVARLIVTLSCDTKLKDLFCAYPQGILYSAVKEKFPTIITARDKFNWPLSDEQHQGICSLINRVLSFFDKLCVQYPAILDPEVSTESYQWILFAIQFLLIDDREKTEVLFGSEVQTQHLVTLRKLLLSQMSPTARHGGNRQALLQLLAAVCHGNDEMITATVVQDKELLDCLLSDVELRTNEEPAILEREGRTTGALLCLLEQLCLNNADFLTALSRDPRLLSKLRKGMHLKLYEMCKRPMISLVGILIKNTHEGAGEAFRKQMLDLIISVRTQWPNCFIIANQLARRIVDGAPEEFQLYAIEHKMMNMLTENFRTNYTAVNKALTFMYDEATWSLTMLRRLKTLATAKAESSGPIMEALQNWTVMARQMGREMQMDIVSIVEGSGPVELNQRNVITPRTRR